MMKICWFPPWLSLKVNTFVGMLRSWVSSAPDSVEMYTGNDGARISNESHVLQPRTWDIKFQSHCEWYVPCGVVGRKDDKIGFSCTIQMEKVQRRNSMAAWRRHRFHIYLYGSNLISRNAEKQSKFVSHFASNEFKFRMYFTLAKVERSRNDVLHYAS